MKPRYPRVVFEGASDLYQDADPRKGLIRIRVVQRDRFTFVIEERLKDAMNGSRWLMLDEIHTHRVEEEAFARLLEAIARSPRCRPSHRR